MKSIRFLPLVLLLWTTPVTAPADTAKNHGLAEPQPADTLPHAGVTHLARKVKLSTKPEIQPNAQGDLILSSGWDMIEAPKLKATADALSKPGFDTKAWYDATVPGTVLTTLVDQGVYPDPYYGLNNLAIPESLNKQDYWYREEFTVPASYAGRQVSLTFNGINYQAQVWFNGESCGQIKGAFIRGIFDITSAMKPGRPNVLLVKVSPPPHPGIPHEQSLEAGAGPNGGQMCQDGPTFFATEGWDWVPGIRDRCTGIWRSVVVHATGPVKLADPQVITDLPLPDISKAQLTIRADVTNVTESIRTGTLKGEIEGISFSRPVKLKPGEKKTVEFTPDDFAQLKIDHPRLWWPNGYGNPELYQLKLTFADDKGEVSDTQQVRFGIRKFTYEFTPDLTVLINGRKIMCKGGNWGMDDALKRVSRERLEPAVRMHRDAHLTMLRNWCGQSTEEELYDLCDEYGILVWNEFWISTEGYNMEPLDPKLFLANARDTITRYRNHASIAIWGGRNEGVPPPAIDKGLQTLTRQCDGTRYYQDSSIKIHLTNSGPWNYEKPVEYFTTLPTGFKTELGLPCVPTFESLRSFIPEPELWPVSDTWAYHDYCKGGQKPEQYDAVIATELGTPTDAADFARKAQFINYVNNRAMFEGWNSRLFNPCTGLLVWMSHPAWPSTIWQFYSWDDEPTAALYGVQKACEPIHIQMNLPNFKVAVINNGFEPLPQVKASVVVYGLDAKPVWNKEQVITAAPAAATVLFPIEWPAASVSPVYFAKLELHDQNGTLLSDNFYWHADQERDFTRFNDLPKVSLNIQAHLDHAAAGKGVVTLNLRNDSSSVALMTRLSLRDAATGARILPAFYSDNYLSMLPGEGRTVVIDSPKTDRIANWQVDVEGYNVPLQKISCGP